MLKKLKPKKPLVLVVVRGGVADVFEETPGSTLTVIYDMDGNDSLNKRMQVHVPMKGKRIDWAAIRRNAEKKWEMQ